MRRLVTRVYVDERIKTYVLDLIFATRRPEEHNLDLGKRIRVGASPRASIGLIGAARAQAFLEGRGFVLPADVKKVAPDVLRHRLLLTFEAEAEGLTADDCVERILKTIPAP